MNAWTVRLSNVVEEACGLFIELDGARAEPVLLRLLDSDRPELHRIAAAALASLGCRKATPRLRALVPTEIGDAAAVALGKLGEVPRDILDHADPAVRRRAFLASEHARDAAALDDLIRAYQTLDGSHEMIRGLAACVRVQTAHRLLEALLTPNAPARAGVIQLLRLFPSVDCSEAIASFLDDNYMVAIAAAEYLLDRGASQFAPKMIRRTREHAQTSYAEIVAQFGLRDEIPMLLRMVHAPAHDGWRYAQPACLEALARLGVREGLSAAVKAARETSGYDRVRPISLLPRLGGKDATPALLEFLRGKDYCGQLPAAAALAELGERSCIAEIVPVLRRDWHLEEARRAAVRLNLRDLVAEQAARAEQRGDHREASIATAARLDLPGAKRRAAELLERNPRGMLDALREAWGERWACRRWLANADVVTRSLRDSIWYLGWKAERTAVAAPEIPADELDRAAPPDWEDDVLDSKPGTWSYYMDEKGRIVVDAEERVIARWKARLSR